MGNPLSPLLASIYMHKIDEIINSHPHLKPGIYLRYVDDIWAIIKKSQLRAFQRFVNNIDKNIKFTFELEQNQSIPFLDTLVYYTDDERIYTKVYRKKFIEVYFYIMSLITPTHKKLVYFIPS